MYKLTDIMLQNLEKDLKKFHELFQGGRCQAWQLEELIAKAIRSDFSKSQSVIWKGNGHDIGCDIVVNNKNEIQNRCINDYGVELSIRPSMSWQIWWNIPLSSLADESKTRLITIN